VAERATSRVRYEPLRRTFPFRKRDGSRQDGRKNRDHAARGGRYAQVRLHGQIAARRAKYGLRVGASADEPRQPHRLVEDGALLAARGVGVALDLRIHGVAQAEAFVAELGYELRVEIAIGAIDVAHRLEKAEREESVDSRRHVLGRGDGGLARS